MAVSRIAMAALLLSLGFGTSCGLVLERSGNETRRQRDGSEPLATEDGSDRRKHKKPRRSLVRTVASNAAAGLVEGALDAVEGIGDALQ